MNKAVVSLIALALAGTGLGISTKAYAQTVNGSNPMTTIVQKLATKFGLKEADVQAVFDEERTARQQEQQKAYEDKLAQLVTNGKITEAQKQLILAKHTELASHRQAEKQSMQGKTQEERKSLMEARRTEMEKERQDLEAWAKSNNIDISYVMLGIGRHGGLGRNPPYGNPVNK